MPMALLISLKQILGKPSYLFECIVNPFKFVRIENLRIHFEVNLWVCY